MSHMNDGKFVVVLTLCTKILYLHLALHLLYLLFPFSLGLLLIVTTIILNKSRPCVVMVPPSCRIWLACLVQVPKFSRIKYSTFPIRRSTTRDSCFLLP